MPPKPKVDPKAKKAHDKAKADAKKKVTCEVPLKYF